MQEQIDTSVPLVSVIVPARNEERAMEACLEAIKQQTHPHDRMEVIVVDGDSSDGTADVGRLLLKETAFARAEVVHNPKGTTPSNLNVGLREATGDIICRVDARSLIPPEYVATCAEILSRRRDVAVAGGAQVAIVAAGADVVARGIARALRNPLLTGLARYRRGAESGPSDTVYLGAFRRPELVREEGWDERFLTNQDYELNRRMSRLGTIWFEGSLEVGYVPRPTLQKLAQQYRRFGRWKAAVWFEGGVGVAPRQIVLLAGPPLLALPVLILARRRLLLAAACVGAGLVLVDAAGGDDAPLLERGTACVAEMLVGGCWYLGVVEQTIRHARGDRLLGS